MVEVSHIHFQRPPKSEAGPIGAFVLGTLVVLHCICIRTLQRRRPRTHQDGLLVLSTWPFSLQRIVGFLVVAFGIVPVTLYVVCQLFAFAFVFLEGWTHYESFAYIWCNTLGIGPINDFTPLTGGGIAFDVAFSGLMFTFGATVIGLCAEMRITTHTVELVPSGVCGWLVIFMFTPAILFLFTLLSSLFVAFIEDAQLSDIFYYIVATLVGIENPLTDWSPNNSTSNVVVAYSCTTSICLGGALVGIVGAHPQVIFFLSFLEGQDEEDERENIFDQKEEELQQPANTSLQEELQHQANTSPQAQGADRGLLEEQLAKATALNLELQAKLMEAEKRAELATRRAHALEHALKMVRAISHEWRKGFLMRQVEREALEAGLKSEEELEGSAEEGPWPLADAMFSTKDTSLTSPPKTSLNSVSGI